MSLIIYFLSFFVGFFAIMFFVERKAYKQTCKKLDETHNLLEKTQNSAREVKDQYISGMYRRKRESDIKYINLLGKYYDGKKKAKDIQRNVTISETVVELIAEMIYRKCKGWRIKASKISVPSFHNHSRMIQLPDRGYIAGYYENRLLLGFNESLHNYAGVYTEEEIKKWFDDENRKENRKLSTRRYAQYIFIDDFNDIIFY